MRRGEIEKTGPGRRREGVGFCRRDKPGGHRFSPSRFSCSIFLSYFSVLHMSGFANRKMQDRKIRVAMWLSIASGFDLLFLPTFSFIGGILIFDLHIIDA